MNIITTNLETKLGNKIQYHQKYLENSKQDLLNFIDDIDYIKNLKFATNAIMPEEIKANNNIEGINDDLSSIDNVVTKKEIKPRIANLYNGYKYILTHKQINKQSLKKLYAIISKDLLNEHDRSNMGEYYRQKPVYILKGSRLDTEPYLGMDADKIDYHMNNLFTYINDNNTKTEIEDFIKSQIIHFYFVYIHPYFDVNGRTSRTLSMWYLLNKKAYPYIILNRAITFAKKEYENKIITSRQGDITPFLKYMIIQVQKELEKEYVIHNINKNLSYKLAKEDSQMIEYFISLNGNLTIKDLSTIYNNYNTPKKITELIDEIIDPLIKQNIFINCGNTKKFITNDRPNSHIALNPELIDINKNKLKYLKLDKYTYHKE